MKFDDAGGGMVRNPQIAIIVVGVLTALAAEQGVEWLHWQEKVEQGEGP
jgi:hypothetical protein